MSVEFTKAELEAYLDEALDAERMAEVERALRGRPDLLQQLAQINARRDCGVHTVGEIWRRHHVGVPTREELGSYLLYVFLFAIGLPADLIEVIKNVPLMFVFCLIIALTNLVVTLAAGKLWRLNLEELLLCVNATLGGAPSAAAMAVASGWPKLILPAVLVAIWGYAIGTFLGLLVGEGLLRLL